MTYAYFNENNFTEANKAHYQFIALYKEIGEMYPVVLYYMYMSFVTNWANDTERMKQLKTEFAEFISDITDLETLGSLYYPIAVFYQNSEQIRESVGFFIKSIDYFESQNNYGMLAEVYRQMGDLYSQLEMFNKLAEVLEKRLELIQKHELEPNYDNFFYDLYMGLS